VLLAGLLTRSRLATVLAAFSLGGQLAYVLAALALVRAPWSVYRALAYAPGYVGWKVWLYAHSFAARGEAPWRELELLVESGLSPVDAITAATGTAAGFLHRSEELGTLRPGMKADLAVLRGDVSRDISAIRTVDRVMVNGAWIDVARYRSY